MTGKSNIQKFRVSRLRQLIFPQELIIDNAHVMTRKRRFPAFWIVKEESIPLRSVASIQIIRGLFFSTVIVENSGGPFPIEVNGLPNRQASRVRMIIEDYKPGHAQNDLNQNEHESRMIDPVPEKKSTPGLLKGKNVDETKPTVKIKPVIEAYEDSWDGADFDPVLIEDDASISDHIPQPEIKSVKPRSEKLRGHRLMSDPLPALNETVYPSDEKKNESKKWMTDLVESPKKRK